MRRTPTRFRFLCLALGAFLFPGCDTEPAGPAPTPQTKGNPVLVHSGKDLVLIPNVEVSESLYVKNARPFEWKVSLLSAPPGTVLSPPDSKVYYRIPAGLSGPMEVHAAATNDSGKVLDLLWTVTATPIPNLAPVIRFGVIPNWIVAGKKARLPVWITDPEGDSLTFFNQLPSGAVYHDSILEWTPSKDQAGNVTMLFNVFDSKHHNVADNLRVGVLAVDPQPWLPDFSVGKTWWIKGYRKSDRSGKVDSIFLRREIRITSRDEAAGRFGFRVKDTLSGTRDLVADTTYQGSYAEGYGFDLGGLSDANPFAIMLQESISAEDTVLVQGKAYPGVRQTAPNTCLLAVHEKYSCGGHAYVYVPGLGRVAESGSDTYSYPPNPVDSRYDYAVWAVSGP